MEASSQILIKKNDSGEIRPTLCGKLVRCLLNRLIGDDSTLNLIRFFNVL